MSDRNQISIVYVRSSRGSASSSGAPNFRHWSTTLGYYLRRGVEGPPRSSPSWVHASMSTARASSPSRHPQAALRTERGAALSFAARNARLVRAD